MSTQQQRQEWRELAAALVPGDWNVRPDTHLVVRGPWIVVSVSLSDADETQATAAFIAAARAAVPALLADVDALSAERDALAAELERVRAQLDAVPVDDIRKVTKAADMDGYSNWRVDEWLDELAQPQAAHTPTPGTR